MKTRIRNGVCILVWVCCMVFGFPRMSDGQTDQASLLLDLKKARAAYEIAKQKFENDKVLYENKAISEDEFTKSKNEVLSSEVDYQKLILRVIAQQSYVIVEKAVKYQTHTGERRIRLSLQSTMEGNQEYLQQFQEHFDVFTPEMRSNKIYNIFVSLLNLQDNTIIGAPYEKRVPVLELGSSTTVDFGLLRDVESLKVSLNYGGRHDDKNIYLEKDASANIVDINSVQFSQEADIGSQATFDLNLERFSDTDDVYSLMTVNLPRQVSNEFIDSDTNARLSQIKFTQGVNTKKLALKVYLPDRDDEDVVIDRPLVFYALVLSRDEYAALEDKRGTIFDQKDIDEIQAGKVRLELIPRGVGRIEVRVPSLYHEITVGDSLDMDITVRNDGTRRLDNIKITTDNPLNWRSLITPDLVRSLDPEKEEIVHVTFVPPSDVGVGAQELKIKTEALADNRRVQTEDKTVRIMVEAKTPILMTALLIMLLIGLVLGIVIFGIKISRR
ncbi:NEW3 domain-containing protein [bacterium]|nr:NEW3 domain-containing protein [bacterium]